MSKAQDRPRGGKRKNPQRPRKANVRETKANSGLVHLSTRHPKGGSRVEQLFRAEYHTKNDDVTDSSAQNASRDQVNYGDLEPAPLGGGYPSSVTAVSAVTVSAPAMSAFDAALAALSAKRK